MGEPRMEYMGILPKVQPAQALDILNDRVTQIGRLNTSIVSWLAERRRLEEQYAAGLRGLARRNIDDMDLGIFSVPWAGITSSMETLAEAHSALANRVEVDIERPLKEYPTHNRELQGLEGSQERLAAIIKDMDDAAKKTEKLLGKGEKADANKVANATSDLDDARARWDAHAPVAFDSLQVMDEKRVNELRDLLTQLQTLEIDQVEKSRVGAEQCLNVLLNVETADEIKTFALRSMSAKPRAPQRASFMPGMPSSSSTATQSRNPPTNDAASEVSDTTPEPKKGFAKGLKRFGTVISRRRESKMPSTLPSTAESPEERKPKPSPFGRMGRSKDSYGLEPPREAPSTLQRPSSPLRMGSEILESPVSKDPPQLGDIPHLNGNSTMGSTTNNYANGGYNSDLADLEPHKSSNTTATEPARDSEGFSVPPADLDPISQAQAEAAAETPQYNVNIRQAPIEEEGGEAALASLASKLQAPPPVSRRAGTVRGRRDARNSTAVGNFAAPETLAADPSMTISEERSYTANRLDPNNTPAYTTAAHPTQLAADPSSSSLVQSPSTGFSGAALAGGALAAGTSSQSFLPSQEIPQSPTFRPSSRLEDNQSIRSGRSTASQGLSKHPDLHDQGLTSSIIETISARFESGQLMTSSLIGEIALGFNGPPTADQESVRLENFSLLDKIAPNPLILRPGATEGEYALNIPTLARGNAIAFKYQLQAENSAAYAPLTVQPICKIEENQASIIVNYSISPSFPTTGPVMLNNLTIALTLEGAKASSCLSKPVGTFAREKGLIFWSLGDVTLTPGAAPERLLARFPTEGMAKGGSVEARWEVQGMGSAVGVSTLKAGADPFADGDETSWKPVVGVKKMVAGGYGGR
ncbi:uncharacterized protein RCC_00429 [Ramularia collo-cygni]|uniref:MHD domain-containing protein n=1 Tax=Ramularia collo-cygni TaxID=112498 RepID=A0A2D3ULC2_9PEZI|nr:uncharacterized protein RCC_00429 [Ramularia collo-cygni]CZT14452.1 uncharacterized protein RCC_00429 [Ramularia collo-cygni]